MSEWRSHSLKYLMNKPLSRFQTTKSHFAYSRAQVASYILEYSFSKLQNLLWCLDKDVHTSSDSDTSPGKRLNQNVVSFKKIEEHIFNRCLSKLGKIRKWISWNFRLWKTLFPFSKFCQSNRQIHLSTYSLGGNHKSFYFVSSLDLKIESVFRKKFQVLAAITNILILKIESVGR